MKIDCYERPDGKIGVRNHVVVIPSVLCSGEIAQKIAGSIEGAVALRHSGGCTCSEDVVQLEGVLAGLGAHPNVAGALVLGLGCENCDSRKVADTIAAKVPWKPLEHLIIQETGVSKAIDEGTRIVRQMVQNAATLRRAETDVGGLCLALECGGSDATSGLAANPALGLAVDRLIGQGASAMFSETTEAIGADHLLADRATNKQVADQIVQTVAAAKHRMTARLSPGEHFLTTGNMNGGLTTLEEKSLGCICKTGSTPVTEVVPYGQPPKNRGLSLVDGTGFDIPSITGMVAAGAQIVAFTTGKGSPVGYPIVPVVKITGNPQTADRLQEIIDVDAASIVRGEENLDGVAGRIFDQVISVACGKPTKAEQFGFADFAVSTLAGAFSGV